MGPRIESSTFRFVAGALLIIALLASGYLLGVTQLGPAKDSDEPVLAQVAEMDTLLQAVQSLDGTLADLAAQVTQLHQDLADLQTRVAEQGTQVEALSGTVQAFSDEMAGQAEETAAQLQILTAAAESSELDTILAAVQAMDKAMADLGEQVNQLQAGLTGLQSHSDEQDAQMQALADALQVLAEETTTQLQVLTDAADSSELGTVLAAVEALDRIVVDLAAQVTELHTGLTGLQTQNDGQERELQALAEAVRTLSDEVAGQAQATNAQLQTLTNMWETADPSAMLASMQAVNQSLTGLTEQVGELQARSDAQDTELKALTDTLRALSGELAEQTEAAASQLQTLTAIWESADMGSVLQAIQAIDGAISGLAEQMAQLQVELDEMQTRSDAQDLEVQALADSLSSLSSEVAGQAEAAAAQLQALAVIWEAVDMDTVLQTVQSVDQSVAGLTEQMAQLQAELSGLQTRSDTQDVDVQSLNEALQGLSSEVAVQAETAASQLQALTELWESADLGALLQAVQSVDQSVTGLLQQVAELQTGMEALQTRSDEQGLEVQALAAALQSLSSEVAGRAETTAAQLQALAEAIEAQTVAAAAPAQIAPLNVQPEPSGQSAQLEGVGVNEPAPGLQMIPEVVFRELVRRNMAMVMRIKANDTIWGIANRFQTPPSQQFINQIIEINKVDPYRLRIGQDLLIPLNDDIFRFIELE